MERTADEEIICTSNSRPVSKKRMNETLGLFKIEERSLENLCRIETGLSQRYQLSTGINAEIGKPINFKNNSFFLLVSWKEQSNPIQSIPSSKEYHQNQLDSKQRPKNQNAFNGGSQIGQIE